MKRRRVLLRIPLALILLLLIGSSVAGWLGASRLVSPPRRSLQGYHLRILEEPAAHGLRIQSYTGPDGTPCLLVTAAEQPGNAVKSRKVRTELERRGVNLSPWGAELGTIVMLHGHTGRKEDHLPICERFCAAGFRCIIPDLPAQGDNPAPFATFGKSEARLACELLDDAAGRFQFPASPGLLFGVSQGGAIALQAAALEPSKWSGVASVATFGSLDVPLKVSIRENLPAPLRFLAPLPYATVSLSTRMRAGFWPAEIRPVDAAAKLHIPAFIAHGDQDEWIPPGEARRIFAAIPDSRSTFRLIHGGGHFTALSTEPDILYADFCQFFLQAVSGAQGTPPRAE